jgi:CheY-like chemotaxis protein
MRALLVDDLRNAGYLVDEASNGAEARVRLVGSRFDLMITDMDMPVMGGRDLAAFADASYPSMPVIRVSGLRNEQVDAAAGTWQAPRFLAKPLRLQELRATITRVLAERQR